MVCVPDCFFSSALLLHLTVLATFAEINTHLLRQLPAPAVLWLQLASAIPRRPVAVRVAWGKGQPLLGRAGHAPQAVRKAGLRARARTG